MIASIEIENLGPHEETTIPIDPNGRTEVVGESESGKTNAIDAVCLSMWGTDRYGQRFDLTSVHDGRDVVQAVTRLGNGVEFFRRIKVSKKGNRTITRRFTSSVGKVYTPGTDAEYLDLIAEKGFPMHQAMRIVMVPMAWRRLALSGGDGRELRDLLSDVLPKANLLEILQGLMVDRGVEWRKGDAMSEDHAMEQRLAAKKARDTAQGSVDAIKTLLDAGEAAPVEETSADDLAAARTRISLNAAWDSYDDTIDTWDDREERRCKSADDLEAWTKRRDTLGKQPDGDIGALENARAAERAAIVAHDSARKIVSKVEHDQATTIDEQTVIRARDLNTYPAELSDKKNAARRRHSDAIIALKSGNTCPTCSRDGWDSHVEELEQQRDEAKAEVEAAEQAIADARAEIEATHAADLKDVEARIDAGKKSFAHATEIAVNAGKALSRARVDLTAAINANGGASDWQIAHDALGKQPSKPAERTDKPGAPVEERPSAADLATAEATIKRSEQVDARKGQRSEDIGRAKAGLTAADNALAMAKIEVQRLTYLVESVRAAPSVAVRRQVDALGDLGPVTLDLPDGGGCIVRVDGRPWDKASTGKQVVADGWFRAGIRRAMGAEYLPIFIDCAQDVKGQPVAPIDDPVILLRTTSGPLEVR